MLDVAVWNQRQSMTVHLVNLTNPMMMKGPVREIIPLPGQHVRIRVQNGKRVARAHLLVAKVEAPFRELDGLIELQVPSIGLHEVIALDFAA